MLVGAVARCVHQRLVAASLEMLEERGYALDDPVAREGDDREIVAEFSAAHEITRLVDAGAEGVPPGDVAAAVNGYRSLYEYVLTERSAP